MRRARVGASIIVLGLLFLNDPLLAEKPKSRNADADALERRVQELEGVVKLLQDLLLSQSTNYAPITAEIDCKSRGFKVIRDETVHVVFFVACDDASPYLEGYRLHLRIGNPYSIPFHGFQVTVQYGKDMFETLKQTNQVSVSSADPLLPAYWNPIQVTISPVKAEDIRFLALKLKVSIVSLGAPRR